MNTNLSNNGRQEKWRDSFDSGRGVQQAGREASPVTAEATTPTPPTTVSPIQTGTVDKHYDTDPAARPALGAPGDTHAKSVQGLGGV